MTLLRIALAVALAVPLFAQRTDNNYRWISLGFEKVEPDHVPAFLKRIREYSVPLLQTVVDKGNLTSFKLYRVRYPNPNAEGQRYEFIMTFELPRFQDLDFPAYAVDPKTVLGEA